MAQIVSDFFLFLYSVLSYWQAYATGGLVTAIVGLFERFTEYRLTKKAYLSLFVVTFLLVAFFFAWRDEHAQSAAFVKRVAELEVALQKETQKHTPDIRVTVEDAFAGIVLDGSGDDTGLIFYLAVKNVGQMPSVVDEYGLALNVPGVGTIAPDKVPITKPFTLRSPSGEVVNIDPSNAIYEKTLRPIPPGGMEKGIFVFIARNVRDSQLYNGADYKLLWRDVTGQVKHLDGCLGRTADFRIPFVPGIEQKRLPKASPTNPY